MMYGFSYLRKDYYDNPTGQKLLAMQNDSRPIKKGRL